VISYEKQGNGMMRLGIKDTGWGISDDKKDKVFKPFERFDAHAEHIEGTGIGLTISKKLLELMDGNIGFETVTGEGSFFYMDLQLSDKVPLATEVEKQSDSFQSSLSETTKKYKILYIEDIPENMELVKQILKNRSYVKLLTASNALDGIEMAQSKIPDLILMDIHLPDMNGLEAFKKLQSINQTKKIPVIALTADAMDLDIKRAMDTGFTDYLTKPIDVPNFLETIDDVLAINSCLLSG
jgi:CheY-like chemotaxis protein